MGKKNSAGQGAAQGSPEYLSTEGLGGRPLLWEGLDQAPSTRGMVSPNSQLQDSKFSLYGGEEGGGRTEEKVEGQIDRWAGEWMGRRKEGNRYTD